MSKRVGLLTGKSGGSTEDSHIRNIRKSQKLFNFIEFQRKERQREKLNVEDEAIS